MAHPVLLADNPDRVAGVSKFSRFQDLVAERRMLPRVRGINPYHQIVGLLRDAAWNTAALFYSTLAVFALAIVERSGKAEPLTFEFDLWRRVTEWQC